MIIYTVPPLSFCSPPLPLHLSLIAEADWNDVCQVVSGISADWKALARHLGLDANRIVTIARENPSSMDECLSQALKHWLRRNNSLRRNIRPSWRTLAEAVKPLNGSLFTDIKKAHPRKVFVFVLHTKRELKTLRACWGYGGVVDASNCN